MGWTFVASGESSLNRKVFAGFPPECELHIVILPGSNVLGIEREVKYDEEVGRVSKFFDAFCCMYT